MARVELAGKPASCRESIRRRSAARSEVRAALAATRFTEAWIVGARELTIDQVQPDKYAGRCSAD